MNIFSFKFNKIFSENLTNVLNKFYECKTGARSKIAPVLAKWSEAMPNWKPGSSTSANRLDPSISKKNPISRLPKALPLVGTLTVLGIAALYFKSGSQSPQGGAQTDLLSNPGNGTIQDDLSLLDPFTNNTVCPVITADLPVITADLLESCSEVITSKKSNFSSLFGLADSKQTSLFLEPLQEGVGKKEFDSFNSPICVLNAPSLNVSLAPAQPDNEGKELRFPEISLFDSLINSGVEAPARTISAARSSFPLSGESVGTAIGTWAGALIGSTTGTSNGAWAGASSGAKNGALIGASIDSGVDALRRKIAAAPNFMNSGVESFHESMHSWGGAVGRTAAEATTFLISDDLAARTAKAAADLFSKMVATAHSSLKEFLLSSSAQIGASVGGAVGTITAGLMIENVKAAIAREIVGQISCRPLSLITPNLREIATKAYTEYAKANFQYLSENYINDFLGGRREIPLYAKEIGLSVANLISPSMVLRKTVSKVFIASLIGGAIGFAAEKIAAEVRSFFSTTDIPK